MERIELRKFELEVFQPAMTRLVNKTNLEFLGILSYGTKILIEDPKNYSMKKVPALGFTDGEYIHVASVKMEPKQLAFILAHEIWHILNYHPARCGARDPVLWNLCVDHVTNRVLQHYVDRGHLAHPHDVVLFGDIHKKEPEISAEDLYRKMTKDFKKQYKVEIITIGEDGRQQAGGSGGGKQKKGKKGKKGKGQKGQGKQGSPQDDGSGGQGGKQCQDPQCDDSGDGDGQQQGGPPSLAGKRFAKVTDKKTGKVWWVPLDCEHDPSKEKAIEKRCRKLSNQGKLLWNSNTVAKGDMPGEMAGILDEIFRVELPWEEIVNKAILYHAQNMDRRSWQTRDYYIRATTLPGRYSSQETELALFFIDTSGSVSDTDLKKFLGICCDSSLHFGKIGVIMHDYNLKKPFHWFESRPDQQEVFDKIKHVMGRGGTSHAECFALVEKLHEEELISIVTFLTDFESDVERLYKHHKWFREIPTIWVLNSQHNPSFEEEYDYKTIHITRG